MMDFVIHLPRTLRKHDAVWVIVDRLTKSTHFLAMRMTFTLEEFCRLYIQEIAWLHGVSISIISDRDPRFTVHFWKSFQRAMGTQLMMSTAFHPQTDGQSEKTIQVLEDMLRPCVLDLKGSWDEHLPLIEFALPPSLSSVHEVFHVFMFHNYTPDPTHVLDWGKLVVDADGTFEEGPVCIMDRQEQVLRRMTVRLVNVLWQYQGVGEATWEHEDTMRDTYPFLFEDERMLFSNLEIK